MSRSPETGALSSHHSGLAYSDISATGPNAGWCRTMRCELTGSASALLSHSRQR